MITLFNRKEVFTTFLMEKQAKVRRTLSQAGIRYTWRVHSRGSHVVDGHAAVSFGRVGNNPQYVFYVHKKDYEKAAFVLRQ